MAQGTGNLASVSFPLTFEQHKCSGNESFRSGKIQKAIASYTAALAVEGTAAAARPLALSNRAQCFLTIGAHHEALADANAALYPDPSHVKSAVRKATALFFLCRPEDMRAVCSSPIALSKENHATFRPLIADAARCGAEMRGEYDLPAMMAHVRRDKSPSSATNVHLDYVHPALYTADSQGKGRAVFSSAKLEANTLLMVSKAFSRIQKKTSAQGGSQEVGFYENPDSQRFAANICSKLAQLLPRDRELFFSLTTGAGAGAGARTEDKSKVEGSKPLSADIALVNVEMKKLQLRQHSTACEPLGEPRDGPVASGSRPAVGSTSNTSIDEGVSIVGDGVYDSVLKIIKANAFRTFPSGGVGGSDLAQKLLTVAWERSLTARPTSADYKRLEEEIEREAVEAAIFLLPSMFNHSCVPNATYFCIGDYLVVRSMSCVEAASELTIPYIETQLPFFQRRKALANWVGPDEGFSCDCVRCVPAVAVNETMAERFARADTEHRVRESYRKITSLVLDGVPKRMAVDRVMTQSMRDVIKRDALLLPVHNQETLGVLLDMEVGQHCEMGDVRGALRAVKHLEGIISSSGSPTLGVIKYRLMILGIEFFADAISASACQAQLRAVRRLCYPEIDSDGGGNTHFEWLCDYCFMLENHPKEQDLRQVIHDCRL